MEWIGLVPVSKQVEFSSHGSFIVDLMEVPVSLLAFGAF
jgi:hypothetical protein